MRYFEEFKSLTKLFSSHTQHDTVIAALEASLEDANHQVRATSIEVLLHLPDSATLANTTRSSTKFFLTTQTLIERVSEKLLAALDAASKNESGDVRLSAAYALGRACKSANVLAR